VTLRGHLSIYIYINSFIIFEIKRDMEQTVMRQRPTTSILQK